MSGKREREPSPAPARSTRGSHSGSDRSHDSSDTSSTSASSDSSVSPLNGADLAFINAFRTELTCDLNRAQQQSDALDRERCDIIMGNWQPSPDELGGPARAPLQEKLSSREERVEESAWRRTAELAAVCHSEMERLHAPWAPHRVLEKSVLHLANTCVLCVAPSSPNLSYTAPPLS